MANTESGGSGGLTTNNMKTLAAFLTTGVRTRPHNQNNLHTYGRGFFSTALLLANLFFCAGLRAVTPSAVQAQLDAQPTLHADTQTTPITVVGQNLTVYGGAYFHRNYNDTSLYPTPQYVAAVVDGNGNVVAQLVLASDGSHRAGLGATNPAADDGQTVSQITAQGDVQTFVWTLPIASGSYTLVSTSLELPDANNVVLAAQADGFSAAPTATATTTGATMMAASFSTTGQSPQYPQSTTQTGITITAGGAFVFNGSGGFFQIQTGPYPPNYVGFSPFQVDLYNSAGTNVATYKADANGNFSCTMGTTAGSTFTANSVGGGFGPQWTIPSGLDAGTYSVKVTTGYNQAVDPTSDSATTCYVVGGGTGTGVNASGLAINYSTTTPSASISATPTSLKQGLSVTVKPSYANASVATLTGSTGSGIPSVNNPSTSLVVSPSVVANNTYTLTAYGFAGLSWPHLQGFDLIYLNGGSYSNTDVSAAFSVSNGTLGVPYYLVYKQSSSGLTLTSNSVTPTTSGATNNPVSVQVTTTPPRATITTYPAAANMTVGGNAVFIGKVNGVPYPTIQWQISTDGGTTWNNLNSDSTYVVTNTQGSSATDEWTNTTLTVQNITMAMNNYQFQFIGSNTNPLHPTDPVYSGSAYSRPAALTVNPPTPPGDIPAMPPLALGGMAAALLAAGYKFLSKSKKRD